MSFVSDPMDIDSPSYALSLRKRKFEEIASVAHVNNGSSALVEQSTDNAQRRFSKAFAIIYRTLSSVINVGRAFFTKPPVAVTSPETPPYRQLNGKRQRLEMPGGWPDSPTFVKRIASPNSKVDSKPFASPSTQQLSIPGAYIEHDDSKSAPKSHPVSHTSTEAASHTNAAVSNPISSAARTSSNPEGTQNRIEQMKENRHNRSKVAEKRPRSPPPPKACGHLLHETKGECIICLEAYAPDFVTEPYIPGSTIMGPMMDRMFILRQRLQEEQLEALKVNARAKARGEPGIDLSTIFGPAKSTRAAAVTPSPTQERSQDESAHRTTSAKQNQVTSPQREDLTRDSPPAYDLLLTTTQTTNASAIAVTHAVENGITADHQIPESSSHETTDSPVHELANKVLKVRLNDYAVRQRDRAIALHNRLEADRLEEEARIVAEAKAREEEEERRRVEAERVPTRRVEKLVGPLDDEWNQKVDDVVAIKDYFRQVTPELTRKDFGSLLPTLAADHGGWLNDEVVNQYFTKLTSKINDAEGRTKNANHAPRVQCLSSHLYPSYKKKGYSGVERWATRAKVGGARLLSVESLVIPINSGSHWTLLCISGTNRTISYYDSLGGSGAEYTAWARRYVAEVLTSAHYVESEWSVAVVEPQRQQNLLDCGVFVCLNGHALLDSREPARMFVGGEVARVGRRWVAAVLLGKEV